MQPLPSLISAINQKKRNQLQEAMMQTQLMGGIMQQRSLQDEMLARQQQQELLNATLSGIPADQQSLARLNPAAYAKARLEQMNQKPQVVSPGGALVDASGKPLFQAGFKPDVLSPEAEQQKLRLAQAGRSSVNIQNYPAPTPVLNPRTGKVEMVQFGNKGDIRPTGFEPPPDNKPTPGQAALDKEIAKEYGEFQVQGGFADAEKQIAQLRDVQRMLQSGKNLTGTLTGNLPEWAKAIVAPEGLKAQDAVEEVVQRNLRLILGAQFTQEEGKRLIARAYNPRLDERENAKRVGRLITQIEKAAQTKADAFRYFEEHGTMKGWKGKMPTLSDFEKAVGEPKASNAKAPMKGQVVDGYKFKGGNPADPESWEKQ